jgi:hypothetical protein
LFDEAEHSSVGGVDEVTPLDAFDLGPLPALSPERKRRGV